MTGQHPQMRMEQLRGCALTVASPDWHCSDQQHVCTSVWLGSAWLCVSLASAHLAEDSRKLIQGMVFEISALVAWNHRWNTTALSVPARARTDSTAQASPSARADQVSGRPVGDRSLTTREPVRPILIGVHLATAAD